MKPTDQIVSKIATVAELSAEQLRLVSGGGAGGALIPVKFKHNV